MRFTDVNENCGHGARPRFCPGNNAFHICVYATFWNGARPLSYPGNNAFHICVYSTFRNGARPRLGRGTTRLTHFVVYGHVPPGREQHGSGACIHLSPLRTLINGPTDSSSVGDMDLTKLIESMRDAPIVPKGDYDYYMFPITDGVPALDRDVLWEVVDGILEIADTDVDRIVTMEAMGIPIATALALRTGIPLTIIRKRSYGLENECEVVQETGYSKNTMFINCLEPGLRILLVDDIISTGGTLIAVLNALRDLEVEIVDVVMVVDKGDGAKRVLDETGISVRSLVRVEQTDGAPSVVPIH